MTQTIDQVINEQEMAEREKEAVSVQEQQPGSGFAVPEFLKAQSPDVPIENYLNHPLNFAKSMGLAQMIRGLEGMLGGLRYAVLDVVMGGMKFSQERKTIEPKFGFGGGHPGE
jgi:hypothetical protein